MLFAIGRSKPERGGGRGAVDRKAGARERGGAERRFVEAAARIGKAAAVAAEHFDIGEQMMAERHRLRDLQVRKAGHDAVRMFVGAREQRGLHCGEPGVDALARGARPQAEIGRDLVVARARGVEAPGGFADDLLQPRFDGHVDVFEREVDGDAVRGKFFGDLGEAAVDLDRIVGADDSGGAEHRGVRAAGRDILFPQALVDRDRGINFLHDRGGTATEAATPHAALVRSIRHSPRPKPVSSDPRPAAGRINRGLR